MVRDVFLVISIGLMFFQGNGISIPTVIYTNGEGVYGSGVHITQAFRIYGLGFWF